MNGNIFDMTYTYDTDMSVNLIHLDNWQALMLLRDKEFKADCIITHMRKEYYTNQEQLNTYIDLFDKVTWGRAMMYLRIDDITDLQMFLDAVQPTDWFFRNLLTITAPDRENDKAKPKPTGGVTACYDDTDVKYVLFFSKVNSWLNYNKNKYGKTNMYLADWGKWFEGTIVKAYKQIALNSVDKNGTILDPFMKNGDVGVGVYRAKKNFVGIESDIDEYTIANQRLSFCIRDALNEDECRKPGT